MGMLRGVTWMTVTDTAGALGASCLLADLTSLQPAPQSSRSEQATANRYHDRLARLSFFIAIVPLNSPVACAFPVGRRQRTMPDGRESASRYHSPGFPTNDFSPISP